MLFCAGEKRWTKPELDCLVQIVFKGIGADALFSRLDQALQAEPSNNDPIDYSKVMQMEAIVELAKHPRVLPLMLKRGTFSRAVEAVRLFFLFCTGETTVRFRLRVVEVGSASSTSISAEVTRPLLERLSDVEGRTAGPIDASLPYSSSFPLSSSSLLSR